MRIGHLIKKLRKTQKMTLQQLSEKSGVALATLSRIENERMTGTIESHLAICKALDVTLPELYNEIEENRRVVDLQSEEGRTEVYVHNKKSSSEMLTSNVLSKKMMPIMMVVGKGGVTQKEETKRGVEKFIYILEGKVEASIGNEKYNLGAAETLYFDGSLPHFFKNTGSVDARIICVITPPAL